MIQMDRIIRHKATTLIYPEKSGNFFRFYLLIHFVSIFFSVHQMLFFVS